MTRVRMVAGALSAGIAALACATTASAQDAKSGFGNRGDIVIGADRLLSIVSYTSETSSDSDTQSTRISGGGVSILGWSPSTSQGEFGNGGLNAPNLYAVPRLGVDYFLTDMFTIGGEAGGAFTTGGAGHQTTENGSSSVVVSGPAPQYYGLLLGVRGGAVFKMTDMISLWPRAGFSYMWTQGKSSYSNTNPPVAGVTTTTSGYTAATVSQFGLDLDPQVVISPWKHVGFSVGVSAGIPLASTATSHAHGDTSTAGPGTATSNATTDTQSSTNANNWYIGLNASLLVYF